MASLDTPITPDDADQAGQTAEKPSLDQVTGRSHGTIMVDAVDAINEACSAIQERRPQDLPACLAQLAACAASLTHQGRAPLPQGITSGKDCPQRQALASAIGRWQAIHEAAVAQAGTFSDGRTHWCRDAALCSGPTAITPDQWAKIITAINAVISIIQAFWA